jgi:hypothetical protein
MSNTVIKDARGLLVNNGAEALRKVAVNPVPIEAETQPEPAQAEVSESKPLFYYDGVKYYLDTAREFVPMDQKSVSRHLKRRGFTREQIEDAICDIQTDCYIKYAGGLAGHERGLHIANGDKILATSSPKIIQPASGSWETIKTVIENLLGDPDHGSIQVETFYSWVKSARESVTSGRRRPGQALALAGTIGSGKSLLIDMTELALGGRRANPYAYFTGRTNFNEDLAGAELLVVDDEAGTSDIRPRKNFGANIKSCLFSGAVSIAAKHRKTFTFSPVWRMVIALNDEPEALLILPPITEDIRDKIHLFHCRKKPLPMPTHTLEERAAFFAQIKSEMPAFVQWLMEYEIPEAIREERCGVKYYHHPSILACLEELSPEGQFLGIIEAVNDGGCLPLPWTGTAVELKSILCGYELTRQAATKLLDWHAATGNCLAKLEGERVERLPKLNGITRWRINQVH